ncbi:UDP-phosphate N-acetylglucosaminyl-1-phosphate transferase [Komagataeibacter nataicola]|uniref:UDP-phosphate N-acetylglucosaminyl-1-phosphate transferase n=1 Tax=Komagataeibacter nataicola TaxID=265960 RepID=A0A9N7H3G2_9PROT|nr:UDP-phosphate N-acetylglucosaminyl-1-phosphate transferase [Komagataeibacter nataicola]AQU88308.1 UDP-phosphate N-acetylglucosaminyl-1-phosphate transferase [Komagataeibacter nataicola]PYD67634.1 UDP-phosphate N-acetylglucosaminyl-1-phosphate transferase [Komagataeibacter nataicola]WEQ54586.1 UDP-phosphate N-acetylglucosaminyl-1-phosphate transferase [Komagataeibacter nataicola]WNM08964.1 UDP-phosphate N-acetylglucosaminyl-1-phosphate transferase [Komagataeibacter nataicola]GBR13701.1 undec
MTLVHADHGAGVLFVLLLGAGAALAAVLSRRVIGLRVLDYPTGRSAHARPVPKGGGLAILAVFVTGVPLAQMIWHHAPTLSDKTLLAATAWLGLFSWRDDMHPMPAMWKLGAQVLAALLVAWGSLGVLPHDGATWGLLLGRGLWLVVLCNAINFMDGLDGLAAGCTLLACVVTAILCLHVHAGVETWGTALVMAVAIAGFLPFNFPKARLFMGDVGSQCCGLVLGALGLHMADLPPLAHGWALMPLMLSGLLADVGVTLLRRMLLRRPLLQAHREHVYQMAHRSGMKPLSITVLAWAATLCGTGAACALAGGVIGLPAAASGPLALQLAWGVMVIWRVRHTPGLRW